MRSKWLRRAGILMFACLAAIIGLWLVTFIGRNDLLPGGSAPGAVWLVAPVLVIAIPIGLWWAIRNW